MNDNYKALFEAAENALKKQDLIIHKQQAYISELEKKNGILSSEFQKLSIDYDKALDICSNQQAILDQIFAKHPDLF